jgi:hypothetical protein
MLGTAETGLTVSLMISCATAESAQTSTITTDKNPLFLV